MTHPWPADRPVPAVRAVEAAPIESDGEERFLLTDPAGFAPGHAIVPAFTLFIMSLLDGERTLAQVQEAIRENSGQSAPLAKLQDLVRQLDEALLLDTERFAEARERVEQGFRNAPARPAALAGASYPAEPAALRPFLDGFFEEPHGPGRLERPATARDVRAVLAPHLDFPRGRLGYAHAYHALAQGGPPELVIVLAVAHASPPSPYVATAKDFETPLGPVPTDRDALALLQRHVEYDLATDEFTHRSEHSAEFQAVWLRHCFPPEVAPRLRILPLLCSSFQRFVEHQASPMADDRVAGVVAGLRAVLAAAGPSARVVGGVDLSHMGPRYGDAIPMGPDQRAGVERFDRTALEPALAGDGDAWFEAVASTGDRSKVCGLSAIYTFCRLLEGVAGRLLHYGQVDDPTSPSIVSYCAAAYGAAATQNGVDRAAETSLDLPRIPRARRGTPTTRRVILTDG